MKIFNLLSIITACAFMLSACSTSNVHSFDDILRNQTGTLVWAGSPAADGAGMLFRVGDIDYGAPGVPSDYDEYFPDGETEVQIEADIKLTGEDAVRGWGATFPEIKFLRIERI